MQIRNHILRTVLLVAGLLGLTFATGLLFGDSGEVATRSLLTAYIGAATAWAVFFIMLVRLQGYAIAAALAVGLLITGYGLAVYSVWFHPAFYAHNWRWMNILFLANLLFAPLMAVIARLVRRQP